MSALSCLPNFVRYLSKYELKIKTADKDDRISWHLFNKNKENLIRITKINDQNIFKWVYNETGIKHIAETCLQNFLTVYYEKDSEIIPFLKFDAVNVVNDKFSYRFVKDKMEGCRLSTEEWSDETGIKGNICFFDLSNKIVVQIDYDVNENSIKIVVQQNKTEHLSFIILHLLNSYRRQKVNVVYYKEHDSDSNNEYLHKFAAFQHEHNFQKKEDSDGWREKIIWENIDFQSSS
jgi:hypothetical protein